MSPNTITLIVQIVLIIVVVSVVLSMLPAALLGWLVMLAVNNEYKNEEGYTPLDPIKLGINARFKNYYAVGVIVGFIAVGYALIASFSLIGSAYTTFQIGEYLDGAIEALSAVLMLCFLIIAYKVIVKTKKETLMNFFEKASNINALEDFFNGEAVNVVIDAEELSAFCKEKVIGQNSVIDELSATVARRAKLNRKNKPLGVFLFVGATGVGKTELAKAVADGAFNGRLTRFDMGEFGESHTTQRLVGAPAGYIGSDQGGALTQAIKVNGSGVILFDEIEKAHPDVMKMLLGLLDEGRITEASTNQTMDASKFIIILTSNASHKELGDLAAKIEDKDELRRAVKDTLQKVFSPEQLGRVDEVFCFKPLDRRGVASVVVKHLNKLQEDVGVEIVEFDSELLISAVMRHEKQASYGIRELLRMVEKSVVDGMLDCREEGYKFVRIEVYNEIIKVKGVDNDPKPAQVQQTSSMKTDAA